MSQLSKYFAIVGVFAAVAACAPPPPPPAAPPAPDADAASAPPAPAAPRAPAAPHAPEPPVRNVIFMIADGAGIAYWSALAHERPEPAFAMMPHVGLIGTSTARHRVPDSAATASSYATGELVTNRVIAMTGCPQPEPRDPVTPPAAGCEPAESWFDIARDHGMARGVVTTTRVIDASVAAFVTKSPSRYWYFDIAESFAAAGLDVMMGGGRMYFAPAERPDGADLLGSLCITSACVSNAAELRAYTADRRPLVGLFSGDDMGSVAERPVSLPEMARVALERLEMSDEGFVLVIETEGTDNSGHANEPLESITAEMLEFDDAVSEALQFAEANPGTLLIVTADHETGGLALNPVEEAWGMEGVYTTRGHTASMVPLFAYGMEVDAEQFAGVRTHVEIGRLLKEMLRER